MEYLKTPLQNAVENYQEILLKSKLTVTQEDLNKLYTGIRLIDRTLSESYIPIPVGRALHFIREKIVSLLEKNPFKLFSFQLEASEKLLGKIMVDGLR